MELSRKIVNARKRQGLTQEQLAELSNVTVRTIQRIESGDGTPRAHTLKAIASVLEIGFDELVAQNGNDNLSTQINPSQLPNGEDSRHFLKMLCLSCFSYLIVPFIHFLIPALVLKKSNQQNPAIIAFAKKMIRVQLYWKVTLILLLLGTLSYNLIMAAYFQKTYLLNYLVPFFVMYFINALIIAINLVHIKNLALSPCNSANLLTGNDFRGNVV